MADIYQTIWDLDQQGNGVKAVKSGTPQATLTGLTATGYVVVNETFTGGNGGKLIEKVVIPANKQASYARVAALFDNYNLSDWENENNSAQETVEVQTFLAAACVSEPMKAARKFIETESNRTFTDVSWKQYVETVWFTQYALNANKPAVSGFEHVFIGEQKGLTNALGGYHFWYKYYLDETHSQFGGEMIEIENLAIAADKTPESVTLKYKGKVWSYSQNQLVPIYKPKGGFWVGLSAEGMLAIGIVRFAHEAFAPKKAVINGFKYNIEMHRSDDGYHLRTLFPVLTN